MDKFTQPNTLPTFKSKQALLRVFWVFWALIKEDASVDETKKEKAFEKNAAIFDGEMTNQELNEVNDTIKHEPIYSQDSNKIIIDFMYCLPEDGFLRRYWDKKIDDILEDIIFNDNGGFPLLTGCYFGYKTWKAESNYFGYLDNLDNE